MKWAVIPKSGVDKDEVVAMFKHRGAAQNLADGIYLGDATVCKRYVFPLNEAQKMVGEFHAKMNVQDRLDRWPTFPSLKLRRKLIREEHTELQDAFDDQNFLGILDGICDLLYVIFGLCNRIGINIAPFFAEVHRSNMTKKASNARGDGKILKDGDFEPPRLYDVLANKYDREIADNLLAGK